MSKLKEIRTTAEEELRDEAFRSAVEAEKVRIRIERKKKPFWHRLFPFTITITRKS